MIQDKTKLLGYIKQAVRELVEAGQFPNGWTFKPTQKEALDAWDEFFNRGDLTDDEKLIGFLDIPTGVGKTAIFSAVIGISYRLAAEQGDAFTSMVVEPSNDLVDQTYAEMLTICPFLKGLIGQYDQRQKELDKPITIITYNSWTTLLEEGKINAKNTDLLISDEAHRGTSRRREKNIFDAYDYQEDHFTARFAVTATSRFDADKTVENTHHHRIYERKIKDSVKLGELAEYIGVQFYKIRVKPDEEAPDEALSDEFEKTAQNGEDQAKRRSAWNKRMLTIFRDKHDTISQDLLWENQAGFFVSSTRHADALMKLFNDDPVLKQRAKDDGLIAPVAAVHSNMKYALRKKRMNDYKAGKYRAIVGDQQFKEGFDHKEMKVIFDFPRGSLVDKAQILGRGTRQWFNEAKGRYEGMTFIDSIVYVGSYDPEESQKLHDRALVKAIRARDILEDNYVLRPGREPSEGGGDVPPLFEDDPDVEEYATLDDLYLLEAEREEILTRVQPISEEDQAKMKAEAERTGLGGYAIFNFIKNPPDGLTKGKANKIVSGLQKTAPPSWVQVILEMYDRQPNAEVTLISEEDQMKLKTEAKRTGLKGVAIFSHIENPPDGLTKSKTKSIVSGRYKSPVPLFWVKSILDTYSRQPDSILIEKYEPISVKDQMKLKTEAKRTGMEGRAIFSHIENPPRGLTKSKIGNIVSGLQKTAPPSWVQTILKTYDKQPDTVLIEKYEPISAKDQMKLKVEYLRTGLRGYTIFNCIKNPPDGLTKIRADSIITGRHKSAPPSWIHAILETYSQQPDAMLTEKPEKISEEDRIKLKSEEKRTGLGGNIIFNHIQNPPDGLTKSKTYRVVSDRQKSAPPSWVKSILDTYSQQPDVVLAEKYQPISEEGRIKLKSEAKRTGLGGYAIFNFIKNPPDGLTKGKANKIVSGVAKTIPPLWIKTILDAYSKQPDAGLAKEFRKTSQEKSDADVLPLDNNSDFEEPAPQDDDDLSDEYAFG